MVFRSLNICFCDIVWFIFWIAVQHFEIDNATPHVILNLIHHLRDSFLKDHALNKACSLSQIDD